MSAPAHSLHLNSGPAANRQVPPFHLRPYTEAIIQTEKLSRAFHPVLRILRQELYYTEPRFHVSIAWAPLSRPPNGQSTTSPQILPSGPSKAGSEPLNSSSTSSIACLSQSVVTELNARFGKELAGMRNGAFVVDRVCTRIGKDISVWKLGQQKHS